MKKVLLLLIAITCGSFSAMAYHTQDDVTDDDWKRFQFDFFVDKMAFNFLSQEDCTVEVTYIRLAEMDSDRWIYEAETLVIPEKVTYEGVEYTVTAIHGNAFSLSRIKHLIIPQTVTEIKDQAFRNVYLLEELVIPNSVKKMGDYVFCGELFGYGLDGYYPKKVVLPSSIESWGKGIFSWRAEMPVVYLPEGMKTIPESTFDGSYAEDWVELPQSIETIERRAFRTGRFKNITLPDHLTDIQEEAFALCLNLKSVTLPASVTHIGPRAFSCNDIATLWGSLPEECSLDTLRVQSLPFDCELKFTKTVLIVPAGTKELFREAWNVSPGTIIKEDPNIVVGINFPTVNTPNSGCFYDLQGTPLNSTPRKGIYIQNGKKVVMK